MCVTAGISAQLSGVEVKRLRGASLRGVQANLEFYFFQTHHAPSHHMRRVATAHIGSWHSQMRYPEIGNPSPQCQGQIRENVIRGARVLTAASGPLSSAAQDHRDRSDQTLYKGRSSAVQSREPWASRLQHQRGARPETS